MYKINFYTQANDGYWELYSRIASTSIPKEGEKVNEFTVVEVKRESEDTYEVRIR
jgi:hypothetical protein